MPREKKYYCLVLAFLFCSSFLPAQPVVPGNTIDTAAIAPPLSLVKVGDIILSGNRKTNELIILREIPFQSGDEYSLEELVQKMEDARRQLMNTALFSEAVVAVTNTRETTIDITVDVKERWYLFPLPYLKPVDRNLNQWLVEQKGSFDRINYGVKIFYNNATGNNDKFRLWLINGYTKQVSFSYDRLYIDRKLRWGLKLAYARGKARELNYNTINDKQVFLKDENNFMRSFTNASAEITYRKAINTRHSFGFGYTDEQVGDTIVRLNPVYFKNGRSRIRFPGIQYTMTYFNVDYIPYPTRGYAAQVSIGKSGFSKSMNIWQLHVKGLASWPLSSRSFFNLNFYGGIKLPFKQPYFAQRFLGYGDVFMQGFEYYVTDGVAGGYAKTTFTRELLAFAIKTPAGKKGRESQRIPFRIFGKVFGNAGYVHHPQPGDNSLSNMMLYSGGLGIDILTFYDIIFRLEWTFNSLGQNGLFLHRKSIF